MNCCTRRDCAHWWDECGTGYHYCNFLDCCYTKEIKLEPIEDKVEEENKPRPKFNVGDKVLCWDGCPGVIDSIDTHNGEIRYDVSFGGGVDFGYYKETDLVEYHKPEYITGDFVGIYGYETDVKIQQMRWDGSRFVYKVYLADKEEWITITADNIAYKVEKDKTPVISDLIKPTLLSARDRSRIDEIIKALEFLAEDKMICYADEIEFLKKIRTW